jgi:hypothetical protein
MADDDEHTCGKGIAYNAAMPAALSASLRAMAEVQQNHIRSLDPREANGGAEIEAYTRLMSEGRAIADRLDALAELMRSYRDLPMAGHDMDKLMDKPSVDVFTAMVARDRELLALMDARVKEYGGMLDAMREPH